MEECPCIGSSFGSHHSVPRSSDMTDHFSVIQWALLVWCTLDRTVTTVVVYLCPSPWTPLLPGLYRVSWLPTCGSAQESSSALSSAVPSPLWAEWFVRGTGNVELLCSSVLLKTLVVEALKWNLPSSEIGQHERWEELLQLIRHDRQTSFPKWHWGWGDTETESPLALCFLEDGNVRFEWRRRSRSNRSTRI